MLYRPLRPDEELDCEDELDDDDDEDALGAGRDWVACGLGVDDTLGGVYERLGCAAGVGAEKLRGATVGAEKLEAAGRDAETPERGTWTDRDTDGRGSDRTELGDVVAVVVRGVRLALGWVMDGVEKRVAGVLRDWLELLEKLLPGRVVVTVRVTGVDERVVDG